jgi:hypothetical protein
MQVEHNLSLSGGTENQILPSLGYNTQEGVAVANELKDIALELTLSIN